jgi:hypothetical protein
MRPHDPAQAAFAFDADPPTPRSEGRPRTLLGEPVKIARLSRGENRLRWLVAALAIAQAKRLTARATVDELVRAGLDRDEAVCLIEEHAAFDFNGVLVACSRATRAGISHWSKADA